MRIEAIAREKRTEELMIEALKAMRGYIGEEPALDEDVIEG